MPAVKVIKIQPETTNSIPESQRPVTIGFGSVPGGTGCTTLACQFAVHAANMRNRTLAISVDRSGDLVRRLVGDMVLQIDTHWKHPDIQGLRVSYCPPEILVEEEYEDRVPDARSDLLEYLPNLSLPRIPDLIVVDLGPGQTPSFDLDFWVVPVRDQRSFRSLHEGTYPAGLKGTVFVGNGADTWRKTRLPSEELLATINARGSARFLSTTVPYSGLLQRTAEESKHIWELGEDNSVTRLRVERVCNDLLSIVHREKQARLLVEEMKRHLAAQPQVPVAQDNPTIADRFAEELAKADIPIQ
jgi:hypothetical protein